MITHIVFFKFVNHSPESVGALLTLLQNMDGQVESLRHFEVGADFRRSERSYDVALITKFDSLAALEAYGTHPAHLPVLNHMKAHNIKTVIVDYENPLDKA